LWIFYNGVVVRIFCNRLIDKTCGARYNDSKVCLITTYKKQEVFFMKITVRAMVYMAVVAGVYAAITIAQSAIGFGAIQFRVAESLNLLAFFNPIFAPAVALGVFLANLLGSPYGILDAGLGTLATIIALILIRITKKTTNNLLLASVWPTLVNAVMVPLVILISGGGLAAVTWAAFSPIALSVFIGQFVVVNIFGYALFRYLMARHKNFILMIEEV